MIALAVLLATAAGVASIEERAARLEAKFVAPLLLPAGAGDVRSRAVRRR
jgi:hypothetical protein